MNSKKQLPADNKSILQQIDQALAGREKLILWLWLGVFSVLALLLFEPKVSIGGDDTEYINRAYNLLHDGIFPTFQGPLYPLVLALLMAVFGVNVIAFKIFSLLFLLVHHWFTYRMFRHYLAPSMLMAFMLLLAASSVFLLYGCNTYTESFYLMLQAIFLYYFDRDFIRSGREITLLKDYKSIFLAGFLLFAMSITRNIGLVGIIATVAYLVLARNWKTALYFIGVFIIFFATLHILKVTVWQISDQQIAGQGNTLLLKNSFRPELGNETPAGFVERLIGNSVNYLGFHFLNIFGISLLKYATMKNLVAILIYVGLVIGFFSYFRKSRFWLFIDIYILVSVVVTFLALQVYWNQERLILIAIPALLAILLNLLYGLFTGKFSNYSWLFVIALGILVVANTVRSVSKIPEQTRVISKYMAGDKFYGFSDDWVNYLNMARWVDANLPKSTYVSGRKPGMAFIYSNGRNFHGMYRVPSEDPAELYRILKDAGVTHVIMANLRANPDDPNSPVITTERRYLEAINSAFPGRLKLVHQEGDNYPAYLYELE